MVFGWLAFRPFDLNLRLVKHSYPRRYIFFSQNLDERISSCFNARWGRGVQRTLDVRYQVCPLDVLELIDVAVKLNAFRITLYALFVIRT